MQIHYISENNSILNHFLAQIRDVNIQKDSMRFRKNIERIGEIMAYELSKTLEYKAIDVQTPLGIKHTTTIHNTQLTCHIFKLNFAAFLVSHVATGTRSSLTLGFFSSKKQKTKL